MKTTDIKGKKYVEVNERLIYFRENYKDWTLESEIIELDNGVCVIKAIIRNPEGVIKATGHAYEKEGSTYINKTSYIENCETSAWGRALGNLGIGIDTSIASAEEVLNAQLNQQDKDTVTDDDKALISNVKDCSTKQELEEFYKEITPVLSGEKARAELVKACKKRKGEING